MQVKKLKEILKVLTKLVKFDKTRPITSLVGIVTQDDFCYFCVTDLCTQAIAKVPYSEQIPLTTVSIIDLFSLVKSFPVDSYIDFSSKDSFLFISCGGKYKLPIQLDIDRKPVVLPINIEHKKDLVTIKDLPEIYKRNSIALGEESPLNLFGIYEDKVITSDTNMLAITEYGGLSNTLPGFVIEKLAQLGDEIKVYFGDNSLYARTEDYVLSTKWENTEPFPIEQISPYLNMMTTASIVKKDLLDIVKRFKAMGKEDIIFINKKNSLNIYDLDMRIKDTLDYQGSLLDITVTIQVENLLRALRIMDKSINLVLASHYIAIADTKGQYIIAGSKK